jgi:hypothetical protein
LIRRGRWVEAGDRSAGLLLDALELVTALTGAASTGSVAAYEASMPARMEENVVASNAVQGVLLSPDGPGDLLAMASRR